MPMAPQAVAVVEIRLVANLQAGEYVAGGLVYVGGFVGVGGGISLAQVQRKRHSPAHRAREREGAVGIELEVMTLDEVNAVRCPRIQPVSRSTEFPPNRTSPGPSCATIR